MSKQNNLMLYPDDILMDKYKKLKSYLKKDLKLPITTAVCKLLEKSIDDFLENPDITKLF